MLIRPYPTTILLLGFGGVIPFIVSAALMRLNPEHQEIWQNLLWNYGAVILSFVGALHWAFAMFIRELTERDRALSYVWSVVPALIAWVALSIDCPAITPWLLCAGFILQLGQDWRLRGKISFPDWFIPLRIQLTFVAVLSLCAGAIWGL